MGRRPQIPGYPIFSAIAATTTQTSIPSTVDALDKASFHVTFSTANSGTIAVQARNSETDAWYDINFGAPNIITAETDVVLNLNQINWHQMRLVWTPTAGAGTLSAILFSAAEGA